MKKKSAVFLAFVAAASISTSSSTSSSKVRISRNQDNSWKKKEESSSTPKTVQPSSDKFAPRFDGLKFIETLVTAHR
ncbi:PREDICTED: uncharacterized protein LOC109243694 [Nicotiana attenuata]|uniref:uncharacterized protein LOC109243694 n=1 Tax=Nicotiana attenuata TaxID=49451 RepID=UPI0009058E77|nr:PREDICTED: uncharacterized protein LOC109243694 [Nicotiana attenuata]